MTVPTPTFCPCNTFNVFFVLKDLPNTKIQYDLLTIFILLYFKFILFESLLSGM